MTAERKQVRALSLLSGGLDSQLALCVLREQGVEVHGVSFDSPFFNIEPARAAAARLGVPLHVVDFTADIVELLRHPAHGFGRCMNPCIDCHGRMLRRAGELMARMGFDFLATGEVLNERPMSQNLRSLRVVAELSGCPELVVRPLSARLLPETRPEREGWLERGRLLALEGRSRKPQFDLALRYGIGEYPTPAGGCRLTEPNFSARLRELKQHEGLDDVRALRLLRLGRHFRLAPRVKLIVGRDAADNAALEALARPDDVVLWLESVPGPAALLGPAADEALVATSAAICARYSDAPRGLPVEVCVRTGEGERRVSATAMAPADVDRLRIG